MNRAPGGYKAGIALKAGTAATRIERKAVATRVPYLDIFDRCNNATELHDPPQKAPQPPIKMCLRMLCDRQPIRNLDPKTYLLSHV